MTVVALVPGQSVTVHLPSIVRDLPLEAPAWTVEPEHIASIVVAGDGMSARLTADDFTGVVGTVAAAAGEATLAVIAFAVVTEGGIVLEMEAA